MSGGVRDVLIEDCRMLNLSGPILSYRWTEHRGGFVTNISARNIYVEGKSNGVGSPDARAVMWVQSNYGCNDVYSKSCWASDGRVNPGCPQPEPLAPTNVSSISFANVHGWVPPSTPAGEFVGLNGSGAIDGIRLRDIALRAGPWQCNGPTVSGLVATNVTPAGLAEACATGQAQHHAGLKADDESLAVATPCEAIRPVAPNLVRNHDFATVSGSGEVCAWSVGPPYSRSTSVPLPGGSRTSLFFNGTNGSVYHLVSQRIPGVVPGVVYSMSASVRTHNLTGSGGYASITGSWMDGPAESKAEGGTWPPGVAGTKAWTVVGDSFSMPADAKPGSFMLAVYVRPFLNGDPTPLGQAWITNVSVIHQPPPPMWTTLVSPVYRGRLRANSATPVLVRAHFVFDAATTVPSLSVSAVVRGRGGSGGALWHEVVRVANASAPMDVNATACASKLPPGQYQLVVSLLNTSSSAAGQVIATDVHNLTVLAEATPPPAVGIDEQSRLVVNGTDFFFPVGFIGFCTSLKNATLMAMLQDSPFNAIMPYGECTQAQMDTAHASGIKVAFSLKDIFYKDQRVGMLPRLDNGTAEERYFKSRVAAFKDHPALLCWYLNDERKPHPNLHTHQQWVVELDANHPTWQVVTGMQNAYLASSDVNGVDYYPIGYEGQNASNERGSVETAMRVSDRARPNWPALQVMDWTVYDRPECKRKANTCHTPTYAEVRSMSWQAIAAGSQGLFYYSLVK